MKDFWQVILILTLAICLLPSIIILGIWTAVYGMLLVPMIFAGYMIWRFIKAKGWLTNSVPPTYATTYTPAPKKKRTIKWQGKEIPLGIAIFSIILAIVITPIFLICLLFVFPPIVSACILGFMTCRTVAKAAQKGQPC